MSRATTVKITIGCVGVGAVVVATAWGLGWPLERAVYLAPVLVVSALCVAGLFLFWGKVAWSQLRETQRPRLVIALWVGGIGLIALLTLLGVNLPRE